jgi:hypothetical protein
MESNEKTKKYHNVRKVLKSNRKETKSIPLGIYIEKECKNYATFWLEKKVGDGKNVTLLTSSYMNRGDFGYLYHRHHKFSRDQCNLPRKKP